MKTLERLPAWPREIPRVFRPVAGVQRRGIPWWQLYDVMGMEKARQLKREQEQMSGLTQTYGECFWTGYNFNALASSAVEASLLSGNAQPNIPPFTFDFGNKPGKVISFLARGIISTTSTPTGILQWRLGTTAGATFLSGASVGVSSTITTASGVSTQWWESRLDLICTTPGIGSGNATLQCNGYVTSPVGFAAPYTYALLPTTPPTGTWTATIDDSVTQFVNLSFTWGTSSASNTITLKSLRAYCEN